MYTHVIFSSLFIFQKKNLSFPNSNKNKIKHFFKIKVVVFYKVKQKNRSVVIFKVEQV